jgi:hypothetical protein
VSKDKKTQDKDKKKDIVQQPGNSAPVGGAIYADVGTKRMRNANEQTRLPQGKNPAT